MVHRHVLDSLVVLPYLRAGWCLDVGSGAGLPGLVLAVAQPRTDWVLLDSNAKKCRFLSHARMELGLENIQVEHRRIEDFHPTERFSTIISRALSSVADFVSGTRRLVAPGGCIVAMKGRNPVHELSALGPLARCAEMVPVQLPEAEAGQRHLVIVTPPDDGNPGGKLMR